MEIIYKAFDGTEFEEMKDCVNYEKKKDLKNLPVIFLNKNLEVTENIFETFYFTTRSKEAFYALKESFFNHGVDTDNLEIYNNDSYYYDENRYEWVSFEEKISKLQDEMDELLNIESKMIRLMNKEEKKCLN